MARPTLNMRIDAELKEEAKRVYEELGMDLTTAITVFLKQSVRDRKLPFQPHLENPDSILARKQVENGEGETFPNVEEWWDNLDHEN